MTAPIDVRLDAIVLDESIQCRAAIEDDVVNEYAEAMTEGAKFPPVALFEADGKHYIGDGWHRVMASRQIKALSISATVEPGGRPAALKHALSANAIHGHRRTNADKRRCVEIALREFPKLSSRAIAEMCGVSVMTITRTRDEQVSQSDTSPVTGADGKQYPARRDPKAARKALAERMAEYVEVKREYDAFVQRERCEHAEIRKQVKREHEQYQEHRAEVATLPESAQQKLARLVNKELQHRLALLDQEVRDKARERLPEEVEALRAAKERADSEFRKYAAMRKGIPAQMTEADYKFLLNVLHPDRAPEDRREKFARAFNIVRQLDGYIKALAA